jgi:anaerobic C4-dicarboxylate transporter
VAVVMAAVAVVMAAAAMAAAGGTADTIKVAFTLRRA